MKAKLVFSFAILGAFLLPGLGLAQDLDRPDLVDRDYGAIDIFTFAHPPSSNVQSVVTAEIADAGGASLWADGNGRKSVLGNISASRTSGSGTLQYRLFEPEFVKRKSNGTILKQSANVAIRMVGSANAGSFAVPSSSAANSWVLVEGCKAQFRVREVPNPPDTIAKASWKLTCGSSVLGDLGLTAAQRDAFRQIFNRPSIKFVGQGAITITP